MKTTAQPDPSVDVAKERLREVGALIEAVNEDREGLYAERLELWQRLEEAGVDRAEMAALAATTPGMVKFALSNARKKESATSPRVVV